MGKNIIIPHPGGVILHPGEFLPPGELYIPYTFRTNPYFCTHSVQEEHFPTGEDHFTPIRGVFQFRETSYFPPGEYLIRGDTTYPQVYTLDNNTM